MLSTLRATLLNGILTSLLGLILISCNAPQSSNSNLSDEEAQAVLDMRRRKTSEVRGQLETIRKTFKPLLFVLADVSKFLDEKLSAEGKLTSEGSKPGDHFLASIQHLRGILLESTRGIVQYNSDGSWVMERTIQLPFDAKKDKCQTSEIQIFGRSSRDSEIFNVTLKDCSSLSRTSLLEVTVNPDYLDVQFSPEVLDRFIPSEFERKCSARIQKQNLEMNCERIEIKSENYVTIIDSFHFIKDERGIETSGKIAITEPSGKVLTQISYERQPGT